MEWMSDVFFLPLRTSSAVRCTGAWLACGDHVCSCNLETSSFACFLQQGQSKAKTLLSFRRSIYSYSVWAYIHNHIFIYQSASKSWSRLTYFPSRTSNEARCHIFKGGVLGCLRQDSNRSISPQYTRALTTSLSCALLVGRLSRGSFYTTRLVFAQAEVFLLPLLQLSEPLRFGAADKVRLHFSLFLEINGD